MHGLTLIQPAWFSNRIRWPWKYSWKILPSPWALIQRCGVDRFTRRVTLDFSPESAGKKIGGRVYKTVIGSSRSNTRQVVLDDNHDDDNDDGPVIGPLIKVRVGLHSIWGTIETEGVKPKKNTATGDLG